MENYNSLFEKAKDAYSKCVTGAEKRRLEAIFPELIESTDEQIKQALLEFFSAGAKNNETTCDIPDYKIVSWLEKQGCEQKQTWSEEDEYQINTILHGLDLKKEIYKKRGNKVEEDRYNTQYNWLKSFKDRIGCEANCTTIKEWSEEDEYQINTILHGLDLKKEIYKKRGNKVEEDRYNTQYNWLKSCADKYKNTVEHNKTCLEKQDKKDNQVMHPAFTFNDILALECCMKEAEKEEELYNQLRSLHNRVHDAYWLNREEEQKETLCNKCRREQPCHSCQDITELRRCALEHQCEQKSNKVEPKFKVGDCIICEGFHPVLIVNISNDKYEIESTDDGIKGFHYIDYVNKFYHLWTIEDAKNGDVVVDKSNGVIGIFQSIGHHPDDGSYNDPSYCFLHCRYDNGFFYANFEYGNTIDSDNLIPATSKQLEILFSKMNEAGYEWNAVENKLIRKQDEKKPTNNVKPKFKVGDWVIGRATENEPRQIAEVTKDGYKTTYGGWIGLSFEEDMHPWTIEDAKNGDVLVGHECYVIFKEIDGLNIKCHCTYHYMGYNTSFYVETLQNKTAFHPAIKEQRDILFQKMKENGYEWDTENKLIRKLHKFHVGDKLISTKNSRLTYNVLEVGHINELGNIEYKVEIFTDGKAQNPRNILYLECCKVDKWANLIDQKPNDKVDPKFKVGDKVFWKYNKLVVRTVKEVSKYGTYWIECPDCSSGWWSEQDLEPYGDQDKQESTISINPKFKVSDWIICGGLNPMLITNIKNNKYEFEFIDGAEGFSDIDYIDSNFHLWTIEDTKDGDVLVLKSDKSPFIFKGFNKYHPEHPVAYCGIDATEKLIASGIGCWTCEEVEPATKEERNFLFNRIKESGYEWDAEKKELNEYKL